MTKRLEKAIISVQNVIAAANSEMANASSKWNKSVIENVALAEMQELYDHFIAGERYFKYRIRYGIFLIKQRQLRSTYVMLDSMKNPYDTELGKAISDFQKIYDKL